MRRTLASWAILLGVVAFVCLPLSALAQRRGGVPFGLNWNRGRPATSALPSMALTGDCEGTTPAGLTFTRTSTATCTRANGSLVTLAAGQPRLEAQGLLVEGAATNSLLFSSDLTQAAWVKSSATCTTSTSGPDGQPASVCTADAPLATVQQTLTLAAAQRATSIYLRNDACGVDVTRDGTTWTKVTGADTSTWKRLAPSCATSDTRCIAMAGLASSVANPVVGVRLPSAGCSVEVAAAQDETGPVATSYIPTQGTQVTRAQEGGTRVAWPVPPSANWTVSATVCHRMDSVGAGAALTRVHTLTTAGAAASRMTARQTNSTQAQWIPTASNGSTAGLNTSNIFSAGACRRYVAAWNEVAMTMTGTIFDGTTQVSTGTSTALTAGISDAAELHLGHAGTGGNILNGYLSQLCIAGPAGGCQ